ncbi:MAG: helix-turn-helix domain-containing protein [Anaerolineae bacterium]|nr:helix-turn-helix domain-containing protein [Anaerolineae bacterium]
MTIIHEERSSDSPYVELVMQGRTVSGGATIRPAESHWHMVIRKLYGDIQLLVVGPLSSAGVISYGEGAELLWIKFKLGVFMPHLPTRKNVDVETPLPGAASRSFWLKGSAWQFPDYDNVETFVARLGHEEVLVCDPVVSGVLQGHLHHVPPRTVRHRFLQATGLAQSQIFQMERAQQATAQLQQGASILDTVHDLGYFDQPHLTRSLKQWIGYTPAQIIRNSRPEACYSMQDADLVSDYEADTLSAAR